MTKILIVAVILFIAITLWSMCIAASRSDEEAERIYQEYLEYKRKREEEE